MSNQLGWFAMLRSFGLNPLVCGALAGLLSITFGLGQLGFAANPEAARLYNQGIDYYINGNVDGAIDYFRRAVIEDRSYTDAHYNLGTAYFKKQDYAKAAQAFNEAFRLAPNDFSIAYNLALAYERLGQLGKSANLFEQIPSNDPKYSSAQARLARVREKLQRETQQNQTAYQSKPTTNNLNPVTENAAPKVFAEGFFGPTGITQGADGSIFVASYSKNAIYRVLTNGQKELFASGQGLNGPVGLAYNPRRQEFYVANYLGNTVSRINANGQISTLLTGLNKPYYLHLDHRSGTLFISEQETNAVSAIGVN